LEFISVCLEMRLGIITSLVLTVVFAIFLCSEGPTTVEAQGTMTLNISAILDSLLRGYDKRIRPNYGGPSVDIGVTMYILSISTVSEVQMDFTMDFYFRQFWTDERLAYGFAHGIESLSVGAELTDKIWVPDTFFVNEKSAYFHMATTSNSFLRIFPDGKLLRSIRLTVTAACPMNLQYFPMDRQLCTIEIESFGYTMKDIRYRWHVGDDSVGISPEVELPQFRVLGHRQRSKEAFLSTGNYSRLACEIQFVRSMGYYLIQIYIPSGLIVIISWVSFWLNRNASPARVALGVTTVLTMTTLMSSTNAALPKISYVKSIDVYLGTCFVMVFAALVEYATVGYLSKHVQMRRTRNLALQKLAEQRIKVQESNHSVIEGNVGGSIDQELHMKQTEVRFKMNDPKMHAKGAVTLLEGRHREREHNHSYVREEGIDCDTGLSNVPNKLYGISPSDIDKYSRIVFPVCFVCFNLMYWIIYLHISDVLAEDIVPLKAADK